MQVSRQWKGQIKLLSIIMEILSTLGTWEPLASEIKGFVMSFDIRTEWLKVNFAWLISMNFLPGRMGEEYLPSYPVAYLRIRSCDPCEKLCKLQIPWVTHAQWIVTILVNYININTTVALMATAGTLFMYFFLIIKWNTSLVWKF